MSAFSFQHELDSLKAELKHCSTPTCLAQVTDSIVQIHLKKKEYELVLSYLLSLDSVLQSKQPDLIYAKNLYQISKTYYRLNQFELAYQYGQQALALNLGQFSHTLLANVLRQLSTTNRSLGNFDKAYRYNMDALQVYHTLSDSLGISKSIYSNGSLFFYQKNYKQALKAYSESWDIAKSIQHPQQIYRCLGGIGATYERMKKTDLSIAFNKQALELAEKMAVPSNIAYAAHNLGTNYASVQAYSIALKYFNQSLTIKKENNDIWGQIGTLGALANLYRSKNETEKAIEYLEEALDLSKEIKSKTRELEIYDYLAEAHYTAKNLEQGFLYLRQYVNLRDSIYNETTLKEMGEIKNKYEFQKKENEIILLTKQSEIDNLQNYLLVSVVFGLIIFSVLVLKQNRTQRQSNLLLAEKNREIQQKNEEVQRAYHIQQKVNALLEEKNNKIHHQNLLLEKSNEKIYQQNKLLESSNEDLKQFAYVASHDLKEPLRMIGAYTSLLKRRYISKLDDQAQEFMHYIVDGAHRMDTMLTDLLSYSRANSQALNKTPINLQDVMVIVSNNLRASLYEKEAQLDIDYEKLPIIKGSQTHLIQLFQNLISNSIKFTGDKKPLVKVSCVPRDEEFVISIQDNGIGIDTKNQETIFEMFRRLHTREEYEGTGIGLATCKKIVERHGGEIWVDSVMGEGSTFYFSLPAMKNKVQKEAVMI